MPSVCPAIRLVDERARDVMAAEVGAGIVLETESVIGSCRMTRPSEVPSATWVVCEATAVAGADVSARE